jgi:hypothetical protein
MQGIVKLIQDLILYWPYVILFVCIIGFVINYINNYKKLSEKDKENERKRLLNLTLKKIQDIMPYLTANAEENWNHLDKSGIIKRSEVLNIIYESYPILKELYDEEWIVSEIDRIINQTLLDIRKITRKEDSKNNLIVESAEMSEIESEENN